jgi:glycosyltransferase involved in cell wall biosynthesis
MDNKVDLYYFILIKPNRLQGTAVNFTKLYPKAGVFKADIYPELCEFNDMINIEKTYVINLLYNRIFNINNIVILLKFVLLLFKLKIDVLHTTSGISLFYSLLFGNKLLVTLHDPIPHSSTKSKILLLNAKLNTKLLKNMMLLNKAQKDDFIKLNKLNKNKLNIFISRLGIYSYLTRYKANTNTAKEYILFFGRIVSYKGLEYLFSSMKQVHIKNKNINLIIAGNGKYYFDIKEYQTYDYFDIRNRFIPNYELADLIKNALFVVCPYVDATQSGVIMSAFAFNKPVLATNVGGLPETIEHMKSGVIVPPKNTDAITNAIEYLLENRNVIDTMGKYIETKFNHGEYSWDGITAETVTFYREMYNNNKKNKKLKMYIG